MSQPINFTLRQFQLADIQGLTFHANSRKVWEGVRDIFPFPYTELDATSFIHYALTTENEFIQAIDVDGHAIGAIGIHFKTDVYKLNGEIGYWLGVEFQGKGIATKAVAQMVDIAFSKYNLIRVYAEVFSNNPVSARVLEKNEFVLEARLKNAIYKDNQMLDSLIYARLNPNY